MDCASDEVRAHQQLLDLGLTAGQIARRTHVPTARVKQTTAVARREIATAAMERYDLTLDQVATIAEFDGPDGPDVEAVKALTVTAAKEPAQFAHVAQRLRDQRADARQAADTVAELTASGIRVLDPDDTGGAAQISGLRLNAQVPSGTELDPATHGVCPGHVATVEVHRGWDRQPQVKVVYWCTAPDENGHVARWGRVEVSEGDGEVARQIAEASEQAKAERRRVIEQQGLGLRHHSAPRVAAHVPGPPRRPAQRVDPHRRHARPRRARPAAGDGVRPPHRVRAAGPDPRRQRLCRPPEPDRGPRRHRHPGPSNPAHPRDAAGAAEDATGRQSWRNPSPENRAYFTALRDWGYPLSPVEQLALGDTDATPSPSDDDVATAEAGDDAGTSAYSDTDGEDHGAATDAGEAAASG